MDNLIQHLFTKYLASNNPYLQPLSKFQTLSIGEIPQQRLQMMIPLLIRNIIIYSASKMQIKLSSPHLFMYIRLNKIQNLMKSVNLHSYYLQWFENELLPIKLGSSKKVPISPFIFIDKQKDDEKEKQQAKVVMLNITEITKQLQNRLICQILKLQPKEFNESKNKDQLIEKAKWRKVQEYITQLYGLDALMVCNFIKKYPYIDEKQLLTRTMLPIIDLRKSINALIQGGIINFYPENARTMLYKFIGQSLLIEKYLDHISQTILNLQIYLDKMKERENAQNAYDAIARLDDALILFGY